jgi:hypothetical protein
MINFSDYFRGKFVAYFGTNFMCGHVNKFQIDVLKEEMLHYFEREIDKSQLPFVDKEKQKRQMKQRLDVYIQGVKDGLVS